MGSSSPPSRVEDVVELMQNVQSRLPVEEAARTSILSKAWLHAWSTFPTLRFRVHEEEHMMVEEVERTLSRYLRDNIPIERFELDINIDNGEAAFAVEKLIWSVATKACTLKELSLSVALEFPCPSLKLPDEILSVAENLIKLMVSAPSHHRIHSLCLKTPVNCIINCVSLREIVLSGVRISQEVLDSIFSSCSLLEKIELYLDDQYEGWDRDWDQACKAPRNTMIRIKNLAHLHEIRIYSKDGDSTDLEISGVPNLRLFRCDLSCERPFSAYSISLGSSVTELWLRGLITDKSSLEMIESGFPFLESLTLDMEYWTLPGFHFTCGSLKTLALMWPPAYMFMDVQVYAPKLLNFFFEGYKLPDNLSFPVSTLVQTMFKLLLEGRVDASFFLNMREALTLSTKCDLCVSFSSYVTLSSVIDLGDLRTRLRFPPADNVQRLEYQIEDDRECNFLFFDAFFEICHPKHVFTQLQWVSVSGCTKHYFFELMVMVVEGWEMKKKKKKKKKMMMKKKKKKKKVTRRTPYWARYLINAEIRNDEKWETLEDSHRTSLDRWGVIHYKLNWR